MTRRTAIASAAATAVVFPNSMAAETVKTQVCVIGGGSGGVGAALAAARAGAKVVLLECESILGGTSTNAWVNVWQPATGGGGIPREIYDAMKQDPMGVLHYDYSGGEPRVAFKDGKWQLAYRYSLPFEPRTFNYCAREMLEATGNCLVLLNTTFYRALRRGDTIQAVEAWFPGKRLTIEAQVFIDSTADGNVCADAGCEYHMGEDPKSRYNEPSAPEQAGLHLNALTLCYRIKNTAVKQKSWLPKGVPEGICRKPVSIEEMPNGDHVMNAVGMIDGNAVLDREYSDLMREGYRRVLEHFYWLQRLPPGDRWNQRAGKEGYSTWAVVGIAPRIGVRETRRILGDYVLTEHDVQRGLQNQRLNDAIAIHDHAVDIHGLRHQIYEMPNGPYGVPYRCLLPRGVSNLFIASRAASFSHVAASSCRLSRAMMTLGQAAGNAAAMCVKNHMSAREIDVRQLQARLQSQGVAITA